MGVEPRKVPSTKEILNSFQQVFFDGIPTRDIELGPEAIKAKTTRAQNGL